MTYDTYVDDMIYPRVNAIGNNKTKKFNVSTISCFIGCNPSYAIWDLMTEDNGLYLMLAGKGNMYSCFKPTYFYGYAAGQLGCGCSDYGHISPTRLLGQYGPILSYVDDVAAVFG